MAARFVAAEMGMRESIDWAGASEVSANHRAIDCEQRGIRAALSANPIEQGCVTAHEIDVEYARRVGIDDECAYTIRHALAPREIDAENSQCAWGCSLHR